MGSSNRAWSWSGRVVVRVDGLGLITSLARELSRLRPDVAGVALLEMLASGRVWSVSAQADLGFAGEGAARLLEALSGEEMGLERAFFDTLPRDKVALYVFHVAGLRADADLVPWARREFVRTDVKWELVTAHEAPHSQPAGKCERGRPSGAPSSILRH